MDDASKIECLYCRALVTNTTKRAHIWQRSLGGRRYSRKVCDVCNNAISTVEGDLHQSLVHTYASVGATNSVGKPHSVWIEFEGIQFVVSKGDALLHVGPTRFDREQQSVVVPLPAGLDAQADAMAQALWDQGLGPEAADKITLEPGDPEPELPVGPTLLHHDLKVGGSVEHKRVFIKMALELLAYHRHDLAMRGELSEARRFARHGEGTFKAKPDTRSTGSGLIPADGLPEVFNAIEVWSCNRNVFFRVVFLGPLVFTGTLTTDWAGEPFRAAYAFDARDPANVVVDEFKFGDGPNLAFWFHGMIEETVETASAEIRAVSLRFVNSKPRRERDPPPDLEALRSAVRERLSKRPPKRKR